jgi:hypothetical protein
MDCNHFRKHHLAYLDDTLPGDLMAQAQRHVMACDGCAAHDTLVRRSLMVVHSMPVLEPSAEFQSRLRAKLAECRAEREATLRTPGMASRTVAGGTGRTVSPTRTMMAMAASAVIGAMAFQGVREESAPTVAMQPVMAMPPVPVGTRPYLSPALVQAMATGNPVWPAAMIVEEAPVGFVNAEYRFAELR